MSPKLPREGGTQTTDALACLDDITSRQIALFEELNHDPIRHRPHRLHQIG
jgi:hypothetical protein